MRIVYMGTPAFSAQILERLAKEHEVLAAYTRPDAVRGRGKKLEYSDVKTRALELGIPVYTPRSLRDESVQSELASLEPELICVAAYGALLPQAVLDIPRYGCFNVHASLLPRWRGAAPLEHAILAEDEYTGVSIMRMEEGLDTGPYCLSRRIELVGRSLQEILDDLGAVGAEALLEAIEALSQNKIEWVEQDDSQSTYASKIEKGQLDPCVEDRASLFLAKVRASSKAHPAKLQLGGKTLTVVDAKPVEGSKNLDKGRVLFCEKRLFLGCEDKEVELITVKPDGKQEMSACAFAAGIQGIKQGGIVWDGHQRDERGL